MNDRWSPQVTDEKLASLASLHGISLAYEDSRGKRHEASEATLRAVLGAMGVPAGDAQEVAASLAQHERERWRSVVPPASVLREGDPHVVRLRLAEAAVAQGVEWRIVEESGRARGARLPQQALDVDEKAAVDGEILLAATLALPPDLPPGYHRLEVVAGNRLHTAELIVCPARCYLPAVLDAGKRLWGGALQLYGLRSSRNWGIGDFTDLRSCIATWGGAGAAFLGLNPLHALNAAEPGRASPYSPSSQRFLHPLYLDVEAIAEFDDADVAAGELAALRAAPLVDHAGVAVVKVRVLRAMHRRFLALPVDCPRRQAFTGFVDTQGEALRSFATFCALQELHGPDWRRWPAQFRAPGSPEIARFAGQHGEAIAFYEYLQWQCAQQLARAAEACRAHGMAIGLYADLSVSVEPGGAETWSGQPLYALGASIGAPPDDYSPSGQDWGLPPLVPSRLRDAGYAPFIAALRANMAQAGALRIDHVLGLARLFWVPHGCKPGEGTYVAYPLADLLGVLALESVRQRCLVIGEDLGTVPAGMREALADARVLSCRVLIFERDREGEFRSGSDYPRLSLAAFSTHDLPTVAGHASAGDIAARQSLGLYPDPAAHAGQADARKRELEALSRALEREGLAGKERSLAIHAWLARSASALVSVQFEDVAGVLEQANLPGTVDEHPNWRRKLPLALEHWSGDARFRRLVETLSAERGSEAQASMPGAAIPRATYRLQLHGGFTFRDATALVPYLAELGVSHVYCSPYLRARAGSRHGYDVVDHQALNPEIGDAAAYADFVGALREHGMGQIADVVPNHMAAGSDNAWWVDVLENGPASAYADYFDIDWQPASASLENRVLLPVLDDHYGAALESGAFSIAFRRADGALAIAYAGHRLPLDPATYGRVLERALALVAAAVPGQVRVEYASISDAFRNLPSPGLREERTQAVGGAKARLARLVRDWPAVADAVDLAAGSFNGRPGDPASFDALHALLEAQAYRLAYWRVASDEINYRRFFDINELAALRMENEATFMATHRLVGELLESGAVDGLRVDHPDGLFDPAAYFERLQRLAGRPVYVVIEKILGRRERVPASWAIHGLTGYRFANLVTGLFVDHEAEGAITRTYRSFTGRGERFEEIANRAKRLVLRTAMASELTVLANRLARIAHADRRTRDFTLNTLREAIAGVIASFPVYRTYIGDTVSEEDRRHIENAVADAARRSRAGDAAIYAFVGRVLLGESGSGVEAAARHFARKFQQLSAPVMAKGVEDTAFYIYNRLVSLNDVGGDPAIFGCSPQELHAVTMERASRWPHSMLASSTHDNKRSEDVRARINVISEMPAAWRLQLRRWGQMNRVHKHNVDGVPAPSANDEYLLYQTLLGTWPLEAGAAGKPAYRERIEAYMLKAIREAKENTSWINADAAYEQAMLGFVAALLEGPFAAEMHAAAAHVARPALLSGVSLQMIKLTAPGVPDCYQGTELPELSLVDPDNRRPVDYALRRKLLAGVVALAAMPGGAASLLESLEDGRAKLFVLWKLLGLRRARPALFRDGSYAPLEAVGPRAKHLFCFARVRRGEAAITLAGRLFAQLGMRASNWEGTHVELPFTAAGAILENVLTGERYVPARGRIELGEVFAKFPGAVLYCRNTAGSGPATDATGSASTA